jgi:hypothetical protein
VACLRPGVWGERPTTFTNSGELTVGEGRQVPEMGDLPSDEHQELPGPGERVPECRRRASLGLPATVGEGGRTGGSIQPTQGGAGPSRDRDARSERARGMARAGVFEVHTCPVSEKKQSNRRAPGDCDGPPS